MSCTVYLSICATVITMCVFVLIRNEKVYRERQKIITDIYAINEAEGFNRRWRWTRYDAGPSYEEMLYKFWRPVNSFFQPVSEWRQ